ncbi:hypothetical protein PM082_022453 [Marasmius tenuissimus]|nr:hypothetical protein PM082_022453 [Marasmius tenuissimus]
MLRHSRAPSAVTWKKRQLNSGVTTDAAAALAGRDSLKVRTTTGVVRIRVPR